MLSMSLKTFSIILMCFDGKKTNIQKKYKRKYSNTNNNKNVEKIKNSFLLNRWCSGFFHHVPYSNANVILKEWTGSRFVQNMDEYKKKLLSLIQKSMKKVKIFQA